MTNKELIKKINEVKPQFERDSSGAYHNSSNLQTIVFRYDSDLEKFLNGFATDFEGYIKYPDEFKKISSYYIRWETTDLVAKVDYGYLLKGFSPKDLLELLLDYLIKREL